MRRVLFVPDPLQPQNDDGPGKNYNDGNDDEFFHS